MKVGILSDIHGNSDALEMVLEEAATNDVEQLLILGDCIGYYQHPARVFELLSDWKYELIKGNHESILQDFYHGKDDFKNLIRKKYGFGHDAALEQLSGECIEKLFLLPDVKTITINNVRIKMCHGSPRNPDEYIYPDVDLDILKSFDDEEFDFIFMGHTHYPFQYSGTHTHLINVGSVGQSRIMGGVANWGILNTNNKVFTLKHTIYSTQKLLFELEQITETPKYLMSILKRNRNIA